VRKLEFRLLGPIEVRADGVLLNLGGIKQHAPLVRLLLDANRVVPVERLIGDLWGEHPPGTAALQNLVTALRRRLGTKVILTKAGGYELRADWTLTDVHRFEQLSSAGREQLATGDALGAAKTLGQALALWRGEPFGDLSGESWAREEVSRLEELRLGAIEDGIDADLALGRHRALVARLVLLVSEQPLRERLRGQLMLALYASGRSADALQVYQETRALLGESGTEPGPALHSLHQLILLQAPAACVGTQPLGSVSAYEEIDEELSALPTDSVGDLFDQWAVRIGRGEWPDPRDYLELAGDNADELRLLMDTYIRALPRPTPAHEDIERAQAWLAAPGTER
jgi:DNA-binding SARP family transcriptional activator